MLVEGNTHPEQFEFRFAEPKPWRFDENNDNEIYLNGTGVEGGGYYNFGSIEVSGNRIYAKPGNGRQCG